MTTKEPADPQQILLRLERKYVHSMYTLTENLRILEELKGFYYSEYVRENELEDIVKLIDRLEKCIERYRQNMGKMLILRQQICEKYGVES